MIDILAFGVHPDDIEFGCGGILAKAVAMGQSVLFADLTVGEKASQGTPAIRMEEGNAAAQVIGAKRIFLDFADCEVFDTYEGRLKLVRVIREHKPRLVIAPLWEGTQNHPDHIACGQMARHACRFARFRNILPEMPIHAVEGILHYVSPTVAPQYIVDVSPYIDLWKQMMAMHKSQMKTFPYSDWVVHNAARLGDLIGKPYAQGLIAGNPVEIQDLMSISKGTREI